ncbi:MAG TPA: HD domain-containing protein [Clostridia bacterium]|nr:HD domain-containing protein [Clostridia bacterium]
MRHEAEQACNGTKIMEQFEGRQGNMGIIEKAIIFATEKHYGAVRKGNGIPYIVHPVEALAIAASMTCDPEILAATVLHDVVEDTAVTVDQIEGEFGKRVASLVAWASEDKMPHIPPEKSWKIRKDATIKGLESASLDKKIIILADKLSNMRSLHQGIIRSGDEIWERFNQKDKGMHEWYYRAILERLSDLSESIAYQEFSSLIDRVFKRQ